MATKERKPRRTAQQKIDDLLAKQEAAELAAKKKKQQLQAQIKNAKAQIASAERKKDTRRKIIAGALALEHMQIDVNHAATMRRLIENHVKEDDKAALFEDYLNVEYDEINSVDIPHVKSTTMEKLTG